MTLTQADKRQNNYVYYSYSQCTDMHPLYHLHVTDQGARMSIV